MVNVALWIDVASVGFLAGIFHRLGGLSAEVDALKRRLRQLEGGDDEPA